MLHGFGTVPYIFSHVSAALDTKSKASLALSAAADATVPAASEVSMEGVAASVRSRVYALLGPEVRVAS